MLECGNRKWGESCRPNPSEDKWRGGPERVKRYQFRLERIQSLRERVREERRLLHAEALAFQRTIEQQIQRVQDVVATQKEALRFILSQPAVAVDRAIQGRTFEGVMTRYDQHLQGQLGQVRQAVEVRRQRLVEAERDVRILEKLDEKQRERYDHTLELAERLLMDELAQMARSHANGLEQGE